MLEPLNVGIPNRPVPSVWDVAIPKTNHPVSITLAVPAGRKVCLAVLSEVWPGVSVAAVPD